MERLASLLMVDDDRELCEMLAEYLAAESYSIDTCHDGLLASATLRSNTYSLVILDVMLPGLGGMDILRELRTHSHVPVIMLTAKGDRSDRILGLELGADDYLPKPFDPRELLARIRAVLRRYSGTSARQEICAGTLRMHPSSRGSLLAGTPLALTSLEYDILLALASRYGNVISREELAEATGRRHLPFDRSIDMHVVNLRRKLGPGPSDSERIVTIRGFGYMLANLEDA
jgi:two-component system, OmpR family, response regulator CpxR